MDSRLRSLMCGSGYAVPTKAVLILGAPTRGTAPGKSEGRRTVGHSHRLIRRHSRSEDRRPCLTSLAAKLNQHGKISYGPSRKQE